MPSDKSLGFWSTLRQLYGMIEPGRRGRIWTLILLTVVGALSEVVAIGAVVPFLALLAGGSPARHVVWIEPIFAAIGADRDEQLVAATGLVCAAAVGAAILRVLLVQKTQDFVYSFGHRLSVEVQRRMLLQPYSWQVRHNSSEQLAAIQKAELVTGAVLLPLVQALAAMILIAIVIVALLQIAPLATIAAGVSLGAIYYVFGVFARGRFETYSIRIETAFEERIKILQEGLGRIRDIILDGSQDSLLDGFRIIDFELARARARAVFVSTVPRLLIEPVGIIVIAMLALWLSRREGGLATALPILGALALGAQRLLPLVQQLFHGWSMVAANRSVIDDVMRRICLTVPPPARSTPRLEFRRSIQFEDVSYTYFGRSRPAVAGLTFEVRKGSRVALVGPTGSGKSTTADLLMGLLEPSAGTMLVDGAPLTKANRQAWRANIAHVPQMLFVADATIAQNIALARDVDMERVCAAASLAQLDGFVASLPHGYDTNVGERGARISGGQRQRLAIARAIYRDAPFLLLDEATSALDQATEAAVLAALDELQERGRTIVIIAHRATTTERCNQVLRLEHGMLVEYAERS